MSKRTEGKESDLKICWELFCRKQALGSDLRARQQGNNNNKDKRESLSLSSKSLIFSKLLPNG